MTLTCCRCWKQFEIYGELAEDTKRFYDSQANHTPDKEVGVCDECWAKCTTGESTDDKSPYKAPQYLKSDGEGHRFSEIARFLRAVGIAAIILFGAIVIYFLLSMVISQIVTPSPSSRGT